MCVCVWCVRVCQVKASSGIQAIVMKAKFGNRSSAIPRRRSHPSRRGGAENWRPCVRCCMVPVIVNYLPTTDGFYDAGQRHA